MTAPVHDMSTFYTLHLIAFYMLISELILHAHIAPPYYYCIVMLFVEQWVASFDGLRSGPSGNPPLHIALYAIDLFASCK